MILVAVAILAFNLGLLAKFLPPKVQCTVVWGALAVTVANFVFGIVR